MTSNKIDKNEFKRLMKEEKAKRIESPLAKYNSYGQLTCILCSTTIKSELYWSAHLNSKTHLEQIKILKEESKETKKSLSIKSTSNNKRQNDEQLTNEHNNNNNNDDEDVKIKKVKLDDEIKSTNDSTCLPKGFFDDKTKDNKIRKVQPINLDNEFQQFKKEIQKEEAKQEEIDEIDDYDKEFDKELEECDELIRKWSKIEDLHKKKEKLSINKNINKEQQNYNNESEEINESDESDVDLENVISLTLRTKNRC
jgi:zinc finger protein 830